MADDLPELPDEDRPPPDADFLSLAEGAIAQHELFMSWISAGFTRTEALQLLIAVMTASIRPPEPPNQPGG